MTAHLKCACSCGESQFSVAEPALFRVICHCTICQRFNAAPFADVLVYEAPSVRPPPAELIAFNTYKPPPNVRRGKCRACGDPAIEQFAVRMFPKVTIVPAAMHSSAADLIAPSGHIFYDKAVAVVDDTLPKHRGFLRSQWAFGRYWVSALRARRRQARQL